MQQGKFSPAALWKSKCKSNWYVMVVMRHLDKVYYVETKRPGTLYYKAVNNMRDMDVREFRAKHKFRANMPNVEGAVRYLAECITKVSFLEKFEDAVDI